MFNTTNWSLNIFFESWVSYYYGKHYKELINKERDYNNIIKFSIDSHSANCNILMLDRYGNLIYSYQDDNIIRTISPMNAMINEDVIMQFNPIQACYIGILAGANVLKKFNQETSLHLTKIQLGIVK